MTLLILAAGAAAMLGIQIINHDHFSRRRRR